jgi:hypothetical protein
VALTGQLVSKRATKYSPRALAALRFTWWNFHAARIPPKPNTGSARLIDMIKLARIRTFAHDWGLFTWGSEEILWL